MFLTRRRFGRLSRFGQKRTASFFRGRLTAKKIATRVKNFGPITTNERLSMLR